RAERDGAARRGRLRKHCASCQHDVALLFDLGGSLAAPPPPQKPPMRYCWRRRGGASIGVDDVASCRMVFYSYRCVRVLLANISTKSQLTAPFSSGFQMDVTDRKILAL